MSATKGIQKEPEIIFPAESSDEPSKPIDKVVYSQGFKELFEVELSRGGEAVLEDPHDLKSLFRNES